MSAAIDLTGFRTGRLSVVEQVEGRPIRWLARCDCGGQAITRTSSLLSGRTRSCGCIAREKIIAFSTKHGLARTPEYKVWQGMLRRCYLKGYRDYDFYGARGVSVCDRWRHDFSAFLADMGPRPSPKHSIDRVDTLGQYEPSNCRWATKVEQANNTRSCVFIEYRGKRMTVTQAVRAAGNTILPFNASLRIKRGWDVARAVETPPRSGPWKKRKVREAA